MKLREVRRAIMERDLTHKQELLLGAAALLAAFIFMLWIGV